MHAKKRLSKRIWRVLRRDRCCSHTQIPILWAEKEGRCVTQPISLRTNTSEAHNRARGFTRLELVTIVATLVLLAGVALPLLASTRARSEQVSCFSNLRQAGHACQVWANDHGDRNPWWTPIREGGYYDAPGDPAPVAWTFGDRNNVWFQWAWYSNQLSAPNILACPADKRVGALRVIAENWGFGPAGIRTIQNSACSYPIGLHSLYESPRSILSGDRNIRFSSFGNTCAHIAVVQVLNYPYTGAGWTNAIHGLTGNLLFTDGSVEQCSATDFQRAVNGPFPNDIGSLCFNVPP